MTIIIYPENDSKGTVIKGVNHYIAYQEALHIKMEKGNSQIIHNVFRTVTLHK